MTHTDDTNNRDCYRKVIEHEEDQAGKGGQMVGLEEEQSLPIETFLNDEEPFHTPEGDSGDSSGSDYSDTHCKSRLPYSRKEQVEEEQEEQEEEEEEQEEEALPSFPLCRGRKTDVEMSAEDSEEDYDDLPRPPAPRGRHAALGKIPPRVIIEEEDDESDPEAENEVEEAEEQEPPRRKGRGRAKLRRREDAVVITEPHGGKEEDDDEDDYKDASDVEKTYKTGPLPDWAKDRAVELYQQYYEQMDALQKKVRKPISTLFAHVNDSRPAAVCAPNPWNAYSAWYTENGEYTKPKDYALKDWNAFVRDAYDKEVKSRIAEEDLSGCEAVCGAMKEYIEWFKERQRKYLEKAQQVWNEHGVHIFGYAMTTRQNNTSMGPSVVWGVGPEFKAVKERCQLSLSRSIEDLTTAFHLEQMEGSQAAANVLDLFEAMNPGSNQKETGKMADRRFLVRMTKHDVKRILDSTGKVAINSFIKHAYRLKLILRNWPTKVRVPGIAGLKSNSLGMSELRAVVSRRMEYVQKALKNQLQEGDKCLKHVHVEQWDKEATPTVGKGKGKGKGKSMAPPSGVPKLLPKSQQALSLWADNDNEINDTQVLPPAGTTQQVPPAAKTLAPPPARQPPLPPTKRSALPIPTKQPVLPPAMKRLFIPPSIPPPTQRPVMPTPVKEGNSALSPQPPESIGLYPATMLSRGPIPLLGIAPSAPLESRPTHAASGMILVESPERRAPVPRVVSRGTNTPIPHPHTTFRYGTSTSSIAQEAQEWEARQEAEFQAQRAAHESNMARLDAERAEMAAFWRPGTVEDGERPSKKRKLNTSATEQLASHDRSGVYRGQTSPVSLRITPPQAGVQFENAVAGSSHLRQTSAGVGENPRYDKYPKVDFKSGMFGGVLKPKRK
ncbi:hypothetical protein V5O48_016158 [Marasmius crinis-equi]|uniref:Uncharacterized protein n=1 Tax=Marasmius crinis-equi TaxID=585013 RepID=A0ABR3ESV2_9AGAR